MLTKSSVSLSSRNVIRSSAANGRCPMFTKRPMSEEFDFGRDPLLVQRDILNGAPLAEGNMLMQKMVIIGRETEVREVLSRGDEFAGSVMQVCTLIRRLALTLIFFDIEMCLLTSGLFLGRF